MKTIYIIDGHSLIYRAYHTPCDPLTSPQGELVTATYIFCKILFSLIDQLSIKHLLMALDSPRSGLHKRALYKGYKTTVHRVGPDLFVQEGQIFRILKAMGIPMLRHPEYEADDIIATICAQGSYKEDHKVIIGRDKDFWQLLGDNVTLYDAVKDMPFTVTSLFKESGLLPEQFLEAQVLMGDTTDSIPGCKGIGIKTATKLIKRYGCAEKTLTDKAISEQKPKIVENLKAFRQEVELTRQLVTLRKDVPIQWVLVPLEFTDSWRREVTSVLSELGMESLIGWVAGTQLKRGK